MIDGTHDFTCIREALVSLMCEQIDQGQTTIGLDTEGIGSSHAELSRRIPHVLEIRAAEMKRVVVHADGDSVDLSPLWCTAYGYGILTALGLGLECTEKEYDQVDDVLEGLGFETKVTSSNIEAQVNDMSPELREYVLELARQKKRPGAEHE